MAKSTLILGNDYCKTCAPVFEKKRSLKNLSMVLYLKCMKILEKWKADKLKIAKFTPTISEASFYR